MKSPHRLGLLVGALVAVLLILTAVAVHSLLRVGSGVLALGVGLVAVVAVLAVGVTCVLAREAEQQIADSLPPVPRPAVDPLVEATPLPRRGFQVREARPGEVPEAYLAAVMRGAQARQAAWRAGAHHPPEAP